MMNTTMLHEALKKYFGFEAFKGQQEAIIHNICQNKNTFVIMPTGAGKSLCYQLPALVLEGTAIVISPLIALMKNQVDSIRAYTGSEGVAEFLNSSLNKTEVKEVMDNIRKGVTKMVFMAPESLGKQEYIDFLKTVPVSFVAVDEAHCISEWGHDFRPEYRNIRKMIAEIGQIPVIALTATATPKVQLDIIKNLQMGDATLFKSSFNRPNLYYEIRPKVEAVKNIIKFIKDNQGKSGIIYCLSRKKAEELSLVLQANGIKSAPYHAGLDAHVRSKHQDQFLMEEVDVIVATIAFGMGIDKPDVRFVIHYDMPKSIENYYQETGRAGRDGMEGICLAFYAENDIIKLQKFSKDKYIAEKEISNLLLNEVVSYAESAVCRRKQILHYFGEFFDDSHCSNMCDACRYPQEKVQATKEMCTLLEMVKTIGKKFDTQHIMNILMGEETHDLLLYQHDKLPEFGIGKSQDNRFWKSLIKFALLQGFLLKDIENYGLLRLSEDGEAYLQAPFLISLPLDHNYETVREDELLGGQGESADPQLFEMLKELRKKVAKEKKLPPYIIFQDPSLEEMATLYPITQDELTKINGVGPGKAAKYGKPFLELIERYVEENEIERPMDISVIKTTEETLKNKIYIIKNIDRKLPFKDIARSLNMAFEDLLNDIESIVNSGTKINITYQVNEVFDRDIQQEITDYFRGSESGDIDEAVEEFEQEFSREDLKLMHIKFIADLGN